ncbi:MAG: aminoglycoside phosphotransferase family protein [Pseudonocardiaceae bacterium]
MTDVLRNGGWLGPDGRVAGLRVGRVGGAGLVGTVDRVWLDYSGTAGSAPESLIVKYPPAGSADSSTLALAEARFYRERVHESAGVRVPTVYHCAIDEVAGTCLLLLEDLGDGGFVRQRDGCDPARATLALDEVVRLHGHWWNRDLPAGLNWVRDPVDAEISTFCLRWLRAYTGDWPAMLGEVPRLLIAHFDALAERLSRAPRTLVHGDFHSQNLAFGGDDADPTVTLIDFQFVQRATGMVDVARFLATSLTTETRRAVDADLLRHYHARLAEYGVTGYLFDESLDDFRAALVWNLATPLALHVKEILTQGGRRRGEFPILQRCLQAIEDWDALTVLSSLSVNSTPPTFCRSV